MKITEFKIRNFRTLESVDLEFPSSYTAICGPNDCGKTNVVRAIRALMKEDSPLPTFDFDDEEEVSVKDDFPKWKTTTPSEREIQFEITLLIERERDTGLFQFVTKQLSLTIGDESQIRLVVTTTYRGDKSDDVRVKCGDNEYTGIDAQQILNRLQSSRSILFHNSTQIELPAPFRGGRGGYIRASSPEQEALVASMKVTVNRGLGKISKSHQKEMENLLGRLETKYKVALSMPAFDFTSVPFSMTLGQKKCDVPLDDWGSGTKNRTLILLTLFRAKQLGDSEASGLQDNSCDHY